MPNLRISLIQTAVYWEDKRANLEMFQKKIDGISEKTELIVLPEMFSTGFSMNRDFLAETMNGETLVWMKKTAASKGAIITGSIIVQEENDKGSFFYNRLIWMLPNGTSGFYDKRHLFAYGKENQHYHPGEKRFIASVNGWKVNLQICYDLRFPVWIRQNKSDESQTQPEFDLLIIVANWPSTRIHAWRTLLQARAIENQCYVVGVNRTGIDGRDLDYPGESMVIGPLGEIIKILDNKEQVFSYTLDREQLDEVRLKFPFWQDADTFFIQP